MTVAIMQPYIFPYLGYFQLVKAVDQFVFFDDVNFINRGWINRNQLLEKKQPYRFTIPLNKVSQNKLIKDIELSDFEKWRTHFLKTVRINYQKAPHFAFVFSWLNGFLFKDYSHISTLASESVKAVTKLLELPTIFINSSCINYKSNDTDKGQEKIINICKHIGADRYINPRNGKELYDSSIFKSANLQLDFINMQEINYCQFKNENFVPNLSIIDVLMFNSKTQVLDLLSKYDLA